MDLHTQNNQENDYFRKNYTEKQVLNTFDKMVDKMAKEGLVKGVIDSHVITKIDNQNVTAVIRTKHNGETKLYKLTLKFNHMGNDTFTKEAKIKSVERCGDIIELKDIAKSEQKDIYFEELRNDWYVEEEQYGPTKYEDEEQMKINNENKEDVLKVFDIMIENSINSGEVEGDLIGRKIAKISDGTRVSVVAKIKDKNGEIKLYKVDLDFNKMKNICFTDMAKVLSPERKGSMVELLKKESSSGKEEIYSRLPDFLANQAQKLQEEDEKEFE